MHKEPQLPDKNISTLCNQILRQQTPYTGLAFWLAKYSTIHTSKCKHLPHSCTPLTLPPRVTQYMPLDVLHNPLAYRKGYFICVCLFCVLENGDVSEYYTDILTVKKSVHLRRMHFSYQACTTSWECLFLEQSFRI